MLKQVVRKDDSWKWSFYTTTPAAVDIEVVSSIEQRAAAIVNWSIYIGEQQFKGHTMHELIFKLEDIDKQFIGKNKLMIFCKDLEILHHFLSADLKFDTFDCNGKGLAVATWNHIEFREVLFIATDWDVYSNRESIIEKLYDYSKYYLENVVIHRGNVLGKMPITPHQVVSTMMRSRMTQADKNLVAYIYPPSKESYKLLKEKTFIGGYCGCTTTEDLQETLGHVDFTTSYIAQALTNYYPMSRFEKASMDDFKSNIKNKCCLIKITLYDFKADRHVFLGKKHAIEITNPKFSRTSKILTADKATFLLTEMDFELVTTMYRYSSFEINEYYVSDRGPLPEYVTSVAEELYAAKALAAKGSKERTWAKSLTEHVYGAMDSPVYGDKSWVKVKTEAVACPYWAIWMVSHARFALMTTAAALGTDFVYADTDSLFFKNPYLHVQLIEQYNRNMQAKVELYCLKHGLDFELYKELGTFKYEEDATPDHFTIIRFKSCGPKRYIYVYEKENDGELIRKIETKIAGYAKQYHKNGELVNAWLNNYDDEDDLFEAFEDNTKITDYQRCRYFSTEDDEPCRLIYDGKMYVSKKYVITYYRQTHTSATDRFTDLLDKEAERKQKQHMLGKVEVF